MISALLQGGLCNVIFQISAASALAWRNGDTAIFDLQSCNTPLQGNPAHKYANTVLRNVKNGEFEPKAYYKEPCHSFVSIPYKEGLLIDGYYQDIRYFSDQLDEIKKLFVLDDLRRDFGDKIGIHIRRGDYLKFPDVFCGCGLDYYKAAMEIFGRDNKFVVVSDDINWCIDNLRGDNIEYSNSNDEVVDLSILASCKGVIGANSSFSLIGAILNKNREFNAIFPKKWFGPKGPDDSTIVPKEWARI